MVPMNRECERDAGVPHHPPSRSARATLVWVVAYLMVLIAAIVIFALLAPHIGMGTIDMPCVLYVGAVTALAVMGIRLVGRTTARSVAVLLGTALGLAVLFYVEGGLLVIYYMRHPPPRPMFHNHFGGHERALLPFWHGPWHTVDSLGHWAWADYGDNVLAIVATGVAEKGRSGALLASQHESRFKVGDNFADNYITIKRTKDALVVILPDGKWKPFALTPGAAESFDKESRLSGTRNLLRKAGELLDQQQRTAFDEFLTHYSEPMPQ